MAAHHDARIARALKARDGKPPTPVVLPQFNRRDRKRRRTRPKTMAWALARVRNRQTDHSAFLTFARRYRRTKAHNARRRAIAHLSRRRNAQ